VRPTAGGKQVKLRDFVPGVIPPEKCGTAQNMWLVWGSTSEDCRGVPTYVFTAWMLRSIPGKNDPFKRNVSFWPANIRVFVQMRPYIRINSRKQWSYSKHMHI
jgi:hypothetical protein